MPHKIKINKLGEKTVTLNLDQKSYTLQYDWPMNTLFNLNGVLDEDLENLKKSYEKHGLPTANICNIEVFMDTTNVETFFGASGNTLKECEDIAWKKFRSYLYCTHTFSRDSHSGEHYTNGEGVCIHCGMFKRKAFEPETICDECNKPSNIITLLDGTHVCEECYQTTSWNLRIGNTYFNENAFIEYLKKHNCILDRTEQKWTNDNETLLEQTFFILMANTMNPDKYIPCHVTWKYEKAANGLYLVKEYSMNDDFYAMSHAQFGYSTYGRYYIHDDSCLNLLQNKYKSLLNLHDKQDSLLVIKERKALENVLNEKLFV